MTINKFITSASYVWNEEKQTYVGWTKSEGVRSEIFRKKEKKVNSVLLL